MNKEHKLYRSIAGPALVTGLLLLIPLIAMRFTNEVAWTLADFVVAGILLFGTGLTYKLVTRTSANTLYKIAIGFALFAGLFLIWANLAVGIIGSEDNAINLLYFGVIAIGSIGAFTTRFQPRGMALTMFAMAIAQGLVTVIAIFSGMHNDPVSPLVEILGVNGMFIAMFLVSALLFRYATQSNDLANKN